MKKQRDITDLYGNLSDERKKLQSEGALPQWYTTGGWQLFKEKYLYQADTLSDQYRRIARTAAKHLAHIGREEEAYDRFWDMLWMGWFSPSTPILANLGTDRGLPVACSGSFVEDSIEGFYNARREIAILTKWGFGTSAVLSHIRPRGTPISRGGRATGVFPVFKGIIQDSMDVSQGGVRRGSCACYLDIEHGDFDEVADHVLIFPDGANIGWNITQAFINKLNCGDPEAIRRYQKTLKIKMVAGRGYFFFIDKANDKRPQMYIDHGLDIKQSNLCSEISLFNDKDHTFTCVVSSMNVANYDEWKHNDVVYWASIFLDCVCEEFIQKAKQISGLEKAVRFTEKGRATGLGQCGFHTYLQKNMIPFESFDAHLLNTEIAKHIQDESLRASKDMALWFGEPFWCKGYGLRNTHRTAVLPTKSTALLIGGVSEGISPDPAMSYSQLSAGGEIERINPVLVELMKTKGVFNRNTVREIKDADGSVQSVDWLTNEEKRVFRTAFEIDQSVILRLASVRQKRVDQSQSLNLFFSAEESEERISEIHKMAFLDPNIVSLYYIYSKSGIKTSTGECVACQ